MGESGEAPPVAEQAAFEEVPRLAVPKGPGDGRHDGVSIPRVGSDPPSGPKGAGNQFVATV